MPPSVKTYQGDPVHEDIRLFEMELKRMFPDLVVTSGFRPNSRTKQGKPSRHSTGEAIDLRYNPEIRDYLWNTKEGIALLNKYNLGFLDESTPEVMKRTGAKGKHFHVGRDSTLIPVTRARYKELWKTDYSLALQNVVSSYTPNETDKVAQNITEGQTNLYGNNNINNFVGSTLPYIDQETDNKTGDKEEKTTSKEKEALLQKQKEHDFIKDWLSGKAKQDAQRYRDYVDTVKQQYEQQPMKRLDPLDEYNKISQFIQSPVLQEGGQIPKGHHIMPDGTLMKDSEHKGELPVSSEGLYEYPGQPVTVPTKNGRITMKGIEYPVLGIDEYGNEQIMYPGQEYRFQGRNVTEIPLMQQGGEVNIRERDNTSVNMPRPYRKISPEQAAIIARQRYEEAYGTISQYEPQSIQSRVWEALKHPATAFGYAARNEPIPEHFSRGEMNPQDMAIGVINPVTYIDEGVQLGKNLKEGNLQEAGFNALSVLPLGLEAKAISRFNPIKKIDEVVGTRYNKHIRNALDRESEILTSDEGIARLKNIGVEPDDIFNHIERTKVTIDPFKGSHYRAFNPLINNYASMNIDPAQIKAFRRQGYNFTPSSTTAHEIGHVLQDTHGRRDLADNLTEGMSYVQGKIPVHRTKALEIENDLLGLDFKKNIPKKAKEDFDYFIYGKESGAINEDSVERFPFLREMRQEMVSGKIIKHPYDKITDKQVGDFIKKYPNNRIASFIENNDNNRKLLSELMNKVPAVGATALGAKALQEKKHGGKLKEYQQGGEHLGDNYKGSENNLILNYMLTDLSIEKGGNPKLYRQLKDAVAYHESGHTLDPNAVQKGSNIGRGKYMFEGEGGSNRIVTAAKRSKNYFEMKDKPIPEFIQKILDKGTWDASKLTSEQQDVLFLGDLRMKAGLDLSDYVNGDISIQDLWADHWWSGDQGMKKQRVQEFNTSLNKYLKGI